MYRSACCDLPLLSSLPSPEPQKVQRWTFGLIFPLLLAILGSRESSVCQVGQVAWTLSETAYGFGCQILLGILFENPWRNHPFKSAFEGHIFSKTRVRRR